MRILALVAAVAAVASVAGCSEGVGAKGSAAWMRTAPMETQIAYFKELCGNYGNQDGTPAMAACIQTEANNAENRAQRQFQHMATVNAQQPMQQMQPIQPMMTTTNCRRMGQNVSCTSF